MSTGWSWSDQAYWYTIPSMTNTGMLYGPLCHCRCRRRSASYLYLVLSGSGLRSFLSSVFFLRSSSRSSSFNGFSQL
ncbi:hypothetical protein BKA70DRAFT_1344417 [Coprinopsis sp. MPI-PUGE-AT-0042]|nr:hypothetical protein BKA70DRAFT_1344417 [Coprinopsis sp. MPI-PUGE-AT-0042]